jgi:hypothetical protein
MPNQIVPEAPVVTFPMACEQCHHLAAMPFKAGTSKTHESIRVAMRCRDCGHEWAFDLASTAADGGAHSEDH